MTNHSTRSQPEFVAKPKRANLKRQFHRHSTSHINVNLSGFVYPAKHAYVVQENQKYQVSDIDTCVLIILLLLAVAFYGSINYILGGPVIY